MFDFINVAFGWLMRQCYMLVDKLGFGGYALALLIFALVCQIVLFPFGIKQQKNSQKQARLRPKENVIRKKYNGRTDRDSQMKMNEELQQLYQEEHFSPLSGCLPLLIQLPILFSLFYVIREPLTYIVGMKDSLILELNNFLANASIEGFKELEAVKNISEISILNHINANTAGIATTYANELSGFSFPNFVLGPVDLSFTPNSFFDGKSSWAILLIPVATFLSAYFGQVLTRKFTYQPATTAESQSSMKLMNIMMPLFSAYLAFMWEASMGLYWTYRSILSLVQQIILSKMFPIPTFTEEEMKAQEKAYLAKQKGKAPKTAPAPTNRKSLIFDDDDDETEMVQVNNSLLDEDEVETNEKGSNLIEQAPLKDDEQ